MKYLFIQIYFLEDVTSVFYHCINFFFYFLICLHIRFIITFQKQFAPFLYSCNSNIKRTRAYIIFDIVLLISFCVISSSLQQKIGNVARQAKCRDVADMFGKFIWINNCLFWMSESLRGPRIYQCYSFICCFLYKRKKQACCCEDRGA